MLPCIYIYITSSPGPTSVVNSFSKVRLLTLVSALSILDAVVRRNPPHSQNDLSGETLRKKVA